MNPTASFLSNGPGDPAATGVYAVPVRSRASLETGKPLFGICLGHQLLALALGAKTEEDAARPSRGQPSGERPHHRQGGDHQPEPRLCRICPKLCPIVLRLPILSLFDGIERRLPPEGPVRYFRCSITPKPRPGRRIAITCSTASSPRCRRSGARGHRRVTIVDTEKLLAALLPEWAKAKERASWQLWWRNSTSAAAPALQQYGIEQFQAGKFTPLAVKAFEIGRRAQCPNNRSIKTIWASR